MGNIDGLKSLLSLFDNNPQKMIEYIIENTYFFPKEVVENQALDMLESIDNETPLFVRAKAIKKEGDDRVFYKLIGGKRFDLKMNESDLRKYTNIAKGGADNFVYHQESKIRVAFDSTGNKKIAEDIEELMGHLIGHTEEHTIVNYEITHLWDKTEHPLFFSSLWNVVLVPFVFARLTDKTHSNIFNDLSNLLKAISIILYNPEELLKRERCFKNFNPNISSEILEWAQELIDKKIINFLPENSTYKKLQTNSPTLY